MQNAKETIKSFSASVNWIFLSITFYVIFLNKIVISNSNNNKKKFNEPVTISKNKKIITVFQLLHSAQ